MHLAELRLEPTSTCPCSLQHTWYAPPCHRQQWQNDRPLGTPHGSGRRAVSEKPALPRGPPRALVARPQHLLCCARRWRSPGASRCRPCGPSGACAGSAGNAGSAGTWPGHCPGCPRRPQAQRRSTRRCLGTETERQWAGPPGPAARPPEAAPASTRLRETETATARGERGHSPVAEGETRRVRGSRRAPEHVFLIQRRICWKGEEEQSGQTRISGERPRSQDETGTVRGWGVSGPGLEVCEAAG